MTLEGRRKNSVSKIEFAFHEILISTTDRVVLNSLIAMPVGIVAASEILFSGV